MSGSLWARGNDGAAHYVWVVRSAAFTLICCTWLLFSSQVTWYAPDFAPTDLVLRYSTTTLVALYLAYAARSSARAVAAVAVLVAGKIAAYVCGSISGRRAEDAMISGGDMPSDTGTLLLGFATAVLTILALWAAWGIARRKTRAWVITLPLPVVFTVLASTGMTAYFEGLAISDTPSLAVLSLLNSAPTIASILAAWAVDALTWRRAGSPDWTLSSAGTRP